MRYLKKKIEHDLKTKMVFLAGPRQVGKTTLSKNILNQENQGRYFNWDYNQDKLSILKEKWAESDRLLIFDELHKYPQWKNWIKGIYDVLKEKHKILVTGSARLDVYKQGGDSLLGRYHYWRLHPFTIDEYPGDLDDKDVFARLMTVGGFPEVFLQADEREARRWRKDRLNRVLQEDIRDLEAIKNIQMLMLFVELLRTRVGGLINYANLAQDLQCAPKTVKSWLLSLERMYVVFQVKPYSQSISRAILKSPKVYFFDNADTKDEKGMRFENLIATTLLKRMHYLEDFTGYRYELSYIRDKEGREIDFVILKDGQLEELIEVKYADENISKALKYYAEKLNVKKVTQIMATLKKPYDQDGIHVTNPFDYFSEPPWKAGS